MVKKKEKCQTTENPDSLVRIPAPWVEVLCKPLGLFCSVFLKLQLHAALR